MFTEATRLPPRRPVPPPPSSPHRGDPRRPSIPALGLDTPTEMWRNARAWQNAVAEREYERERLRQPVPPSTPVGMLLVGDYGGFRDVVTDTLPNRWDAVRIAAGYEPRTLRNELADAEWRLPYAEQVRRATASLSPYGRQRLSEMDVTHTPSWVPKGYETHHAWYNRQESPSIYSRLNGTPIPPEVIEEVVVRPKFMRAETRPTFRHEIAHGIDVGLDGVPGQVLAGIASMPFSPWREVREMATRFPGMAGNPLAPVGPSWAPWGGPGEFYADMAERGKRAIPDEALLFFPQYWAEREVPMGLAERLRQSVPPPPPGP